MFFPQRENIGMNWTYSLERMPSPRGDNRHLVRVTSRARNAREDVRVRFFTNVDEHAVRVGLNFENFRIIKFNISAKLSDVSLICGALICQKGKMNVLLLNSFYIFIGPYHRYTKKTDPLY